MLNDSYAESENNRNEIKENNANTTNTNKTLQESKLTKNIEKKCYKIWRIYFFIFRLAYTRKTKEKSKRNR